MTGPLHRELDLALARRERAGAPGRADSRLLAAGRGWSVSDVVCTSGAEDRRFEERHTRFGVAVVVAGLFDYRAGNGRETLTPGSLLLGNAGACFECGHEHGRGDRCLAFQYEPELFDRLAADAGAARAERRFGRSRLPPLRATARLAARASAALSAAGGPVPDAAWEEIAIELAGRAVELEAGLPSRGATPPPAAERRVLEAVRRIDRDPALDHSLSALARDAGLSPFHFLRSFERVTGVTPHQFVLRARLRDAALRLRTGGERVVDIAFDAGFGDLSNFNRTFRAELGATPTAFRAAAG